MNKGTRELPKEWVHGTVCRTEGVWVKSYTAAASSTTTWSLIVKSSEPAKLYHNKPNIDIFHPHNLSIEPSASTQCQKREEPEA